MFGRKPPDFEALKKLSEQVNSSEINKLDFLKKIEKNSSKHLAAGIGLVIIGRNQEALEKLNKATDSKEKFIYTGYAQRELGQYDKAVTSFEKAEKKGVDSLMVTLEKACTLRLAGKVDDASKLLDACGNFKNVSAEYHYQLGRLADAKGDYSDAIANYQKVADLDPAHHNGLFHLAYACDLRGDDEAAIDYYKQLTKEKPVPVNALLNLSVLYEDRELYDKATACIDTVLKSHPNNLRAILFKKDIESSKVMVYDEEREKQIDRHYQLLEIPISDFELSVRSRNCLKKMNIYTIGDLLRISESELLSYKNFGETSLVEIKKILEPKNLTLGMALEDERAEGGDETDAAYEEVLNKLVDDLELSVRARRALTKLGLRTAGEVAAKTEAELLGCKNFGVTSLNEVKECLANLGLSFRTLEEQRVLVIL